MTNNRVVVKIGSSSLTKNDGALSIAKLEEHASAIANLVQHGYEVVLISSGAVSAGFRDLGYSSRPVTVAGKQAAASVGQGLLIEAYNEAFKKFNIVSAQLLLTRSVFANQTQYSNAYQTMTELLKRSVVPVINENDSVAIDELTFGDNDMLSALVSGLINADYLIMLTDINGIYDSNPNYNKKAKRYDKLSAITDHLINQTSQKSSSKVGTGGMKSKLMAAKIATTLGVQCFIGIGEGEDKLVEILNGKGNGTYIGNEHLTRIRKHKQWIALHSKVNGQILIDHGAMNAILLNGKSLLPAGIVDVRQQFNANDVVELIFEGQTIAKGQVNYNSEDLIEIKGLSSYEAMKLTHVDRPEVIHRDKLVLMYREEIKNDSLNSNS